MLKFHASFHVSVKKRRLFVCRSIRQVTYDTQHALNHSFGCTSVQHSDACLCTRPAPALIGEFVLPTGLKLNGVEFGGISGLDYDPAQNVYYAISDDRSEKAPARFYKLKLDIDGAGIHGLDILETSTLLDAGASLSSSRMSMRKASALIRRVRHSTGPAKAIAQESRLSVK